MKITKNQEKILNVLKSEELISALEISDRLKELDTSTVYRNLDKLVAIGAIKQHNFDNKESRYEISNSHQHAVCIECGKVRHISLTKDKVLKLIPKDLDFEVDEVELVLKGRCKV